MLRILFERYKAYVYLGLAGLLIAGTLSKALHGRPWEAAGNGVLVVAALLAAVLSMRASRRD